MITVKKYSKQNREEWDAHVAASKTPLFMFMRGYMDYHSDRFTDHSLMFYMNDELIGVLPASVKDGVITSHGGLTYGGILSSHNMKQYKMLDCFAAMREYYASCGMKKLLYKSIPYIFSNYPSQEDLYAIFRNGGLLVKSECSCVVNLLNPVKISKARKSHISRAKREGVSIEESQDYGAFINLQNDVLLRYHNTTAVHTASELCLLASRFPDNLKLYIAKHMGRMIAATFLYIYPKAVHAQYLAADDTAREIGGLDLLIKTLMDYYAEKKQWFDFGISTEQGGLFLNEGLIAQKEGFGGRTVVQQTWEIPIL